ncbi:hypothetical protein DFH09DRAFT_1177850, partial [Mycena vulgaris]
MIIVRPFLVRCSADISGQSGVSSFLIMPMPFRWLSLPSLPSLPRSTTSRCLKPPLTGPRKLTEGAGSGRGTCNAAASRGGAYAAVLLLDAERMDARDSGMEPSFLYPHRALPSLLRAFTSSQRTAPIHPHPTPQSPARHPTSEHCGPSPAQYRAMPMQRNDGGRRRRGDAHGLTRSPPSPPAPAQVHAVPHAPRPHQHDLCLRALTLTV